MFKKISFFVLVTLSSVLIFVNCGKTEISKSKTQTLANNDLRLPAGNIDTTFRTFFDRGGNDYGCEQPPWDCRPDIIIYPNPVVANGKSSNVLYESLRVIFNAISSGNKDLVAKTFDSQKSVFSEVIDPTILNNAINKQLYLATKGDINSGLVYFLFKNVENEIIAVYPFNVMR